MRASNVRTIRFNREPVPGKDAVSYRLVPSCASVPLRWSGDTLVSDITGITLRVIRQTGDDTPVTILPPSWEAEDLRISCSYGLGDKTSPEFSYNSVTGIPVDVLASGVTARLIRSGVEVYTLTIPFISDGRPGNPGADSVTWSLVPSVTAVRYDTMTGIYAPTALSCRLMRHDGEAVSEIDYPSDEGLAMWFFVDSNRGQYVPGMDMQLLYTVRPSRFAFVVTKGTVEVARVDIPVVTNGPYIPFPRLWEEYPDDYTFKQGKDDEERRDLVLARDENTGKLYACSCKKTHVKNKDYPPLPIGGKGKDYWETGEQQTFVATDLLFAELTYVRNLMAEYVQMLDADGKVLFEVFEGHVIARTGTFENVSVSGTVSAGDPHGRRVLLDPDGKAVRIYDDDSNECARLDGSSYSFKSVMPAAGQSLPEPDKKAISMTAEATSTTMATSTAVAMARSASTATGIGSVRVTVEADVSMPTAVSPRATVDEMKPVMVKAARVYCIVATYDEKGLLLDSSRHLITACDEFLSGKDTRTFTVAVPKGRHEISFELQATGDTARATVKLTQAAFVADAMMTRYFRNGLALTKDTENYLIALYDSAAKRMRLLLGGTLEINEVRQPATVYAGRVSDSSTSASTPATLTSQLYPGESAGVTLTKNSTPTAGYTLRFPAKYGLTPANTLVRLTGYGGVAEKPSEYPSKPAVKSITASGSELLVTVWVSDDASPNYGGFCIEVCRTD